MTDSILAYTIQFATLLAVAMAATEIFTFKVGAPADPSGLTFIERNGTRKPIHAFAYSFALSIPAAWLGLLTAPEGVVGAWRWTVFLAFMSFVVVVASFGLVKARKLFS